MSSLPADQQFAELLELRKNRASDNMKDIYRLADGTTAGDDLVNRAFYRSYRK